MATTILVVKGSSSKEVKVFRNITLGQAQKIQSFIAGGNWKVAEGWVAKSAKIAS